MSGKDDGWVEDDEAALVAAFNAGERREAGVTSTLGKISDPTDNPDVDTEVDGDGHVAAAKRAPQEGDGVGVWLQSWWTQRQVDKNKEYGIDPFVRAKIGRHGKAARTKCWLSTRKDPPEVYLNPKFSKAHENELRLVRTAGDMGEVILEVLDEDADKDKFVGACHVHLTQFLLHAQETDAWKHTMFHLYDHQEGEDGDDTGEDRDAGGVHALVRWEPALDEAGAWKVDEETGQAQGELVIRVLAGTDLRDVSNIHISDIGSFADTGTFYTTLYVMLGYLVAGTLFYRFAIWGTEGKITTGWCASDSVGCNRDDCVSRGGRWEPIPNTIGEGICEHERYMHLTVDSLLFVMTTFTTVGYGDHPELLETVLERLSTVFFIIIGMAILGVVIGTWGDMFKVKVDQKKRRVREKTLKLMQEKGMDVDKLDASDDIKQEVMRKLHKKYAEDEIDEHLLQIEMGKALIHHFWVDELKKMVAGAVGLLSILLLGTAVFMSTEADQCFQSELPPQNCSGVGPEPLPQTQGGCGLQQWPRACEPDATCDDRKTWEQFRAEYPQAMLCDEGQAHGLTFIDSLYFTTVTASTVGYGDVTPQSYYGKVFAFFYIPIAVALMSKTIMSIALIPMEYRHLKLEAYVLDQFGDELSAPDFADLKSSVNLGPEEPIRINDFTLAMLCVHSTTRLWVLVVAVLLTNARWLRLQVAARSDRQVRHHADRADLLAAGQGQERGAGEAGRAGPSLTAEAPDGGDGGGW